MYAICAAIGGVPALRRGTHPCAIAACTVMPAAQNAHPARLLDRTLAPWRDRLPGHEVITVRFQGQRGLPAIEHRQALKTDISADEADAIQDSAGA